MKVEITYFWFIRQHIFISIDNNNIVVVVHYVFQWLSDNLLEYNSRVVLDFRISYMSYPAVVGCKNEFVIYRCRFNDLTIWESKCQSIFSWGVVRQMSSVGMAYGRGV
jgi:hypothetical protein